MHGGPKFDQDFHHYCKAKLKVNLLANSGKHCIRIRECVRNLILGYPIVQKKLEHVLGEIYRVNLELLWYPRILGQGPR